MGQIPIIEIRGLHKEFRHTEETSLSVRAIEHIDLDIYEGEFISIIGPSGCGKTTMLNILGGLDYSTGGNVSIYGKEILAPHPKVAMVFQEFSIFPWRSVNKNLEFGLELRKVPKEARREACEGVLRKVGLQKFGNHYPRQLSGGMQQRVALARALVLNPEILLLDEPFGALDEQTRFLLALELMNFMAPDSPDEPRKTIVLVTHSIREAVLLSDRVVVMTARPATVKEVVEVSIPRPRTTETLVDKNFNRIESHIWHQLSVESQKAIQTTGDGDERSH